MNVIFLDFDGVFNTFHGRDFDMIEKKIEILADICHEYKCKVVIEAALKDSINEETLETDNFFVRKIMDLFCQYGIECIGRTPNVLKCIDKDIYVSMWKEDEIRLYLYRHPEIEHYCVIDDDDLVMFSDLEKVRSHLVKTIYYSDFVSEEGLLASHKEEIGDILKKDNEIREMILKRRK